MLILVGGALVLLFAVNIYRAVTQAITYDEAGTYLYLVSGTWADALTGFNTHVLYSLLANVTTSVFGPSEFALRLPTVAAGALYFGVGFLLCRAVFGEGLLFVAVLGAIALNPFVLDFLSVARGYGLALALLLVALHQIFRAVGSHAGAARRRWRTAGVALGFSAAANLAFAFPATALGLTAVLIALLMGSSTEGDKAAVARQVGDFSGAALLSTAAILAVDLPRFRGRVSDEVFKLSLSPGRGKLPPRSGGVEHSDARDRRLYVRIRNRLTRIRPATPLSERLDARS